MTDQNQTQMCEKEYEEFVSMINNWDEDHIWTALRIIDPEYLWQALYGKFGDYRATVDAMKQITK